MYFIRVWFTLLNSFNRYIVECKFTSVAPVVIAVLVLIDT